MNTLISPAAGNHISRLGSHPSHSSALSHKWLSVLLAVLFVPAVVQAADWPMPGLAPMDLPPAQAQLLADQYGIEVMSLRLSSAGYMADFRYRILDPAKAAPLMDKSVKPYLLDPASGAKFTVPTYAKVGALRAVTAAPLANRTYFILFSNAGRYLEPGSTVTVVIGDIKLENIKVL